MKIEDIPIEKLVVPAPPMLDEAIGYPGRARYVAFYWTPYGDEVIYTDGRFSADGHWPRLATVYSSQNDRAASPSLQSGEL